MRRRDPRLLRLLSILPLLAALSGGCGEDTPTGGGGPDDLTPTYFIERGIDGTLIGAARIPVALNRDNAEHRAEYYVHAGLPHAPLVQVAWRPEDAGGTYDWTAGVAGGPALRGRIGKAGRGDWSFLLDGWGEFDLRRGLFHEASAPVVLDPRSPLSYALLGWAWDDAARPDSVDLPLLLLDEPTRAPLAVLGRLHYEGTTAGDVDSLRGFHLDLNDERIFFKLWQSHFPALYAAWRETTQLSLKFVGENPLDVSLAPPAAPAPEGYAVQPEPVHVGGTALAAERYRPEGDGPFPGLLLVADDGPADRSDAGLFDHLAHALARAGWLLLRFDKLGTGESGGVLDELDLEERREAMAAAWEALLTDVALDGDRALLLGHGEGAALCLELAGVDARAAGVVALAPPRYRPGEMIRIQEADEAPGDFVSALGRSAFIGKYRDLLAFDEEVIWPLVTCPVALYRGELDARVSFADFADTELLLGDTALTSVQFPLLDHWFSAELPGFPPGDALVDTLLSWLGDTFPPAP